MITESRALVRYRFWLAIACCSQSLAGCVTVTPDAAPVRPLNSVRANGCAGRPGVDVALRADVRLDAVAARVSRGARLADAMAGERYPAARSTSIHVVGAPDETAMTRLLHSRFCAEITDAAFAAVGLARREGETWFVLAAPFTPPKSVDMHEVGGRTLELVNAARSRPRQCGGRRFAAIGPLRLDATLGRVADAHAHDMARHSRMSHDGSDGSTAAERVTRAGYPWRSVAENVASGQSTPDAVVQTWLDSPGHCANIMSPDMQEMGIAYAFEASSDDGIYWAQVFGARR
jgi:uncharacterized protein YkwD